MKTMIIIVSVIIVVLIAVVPGHQKWQQNSSATESIPKGEEQRFEEDAKVQIMGTKSSSTGGYRWAWPVKRYTLKRSRIGRLNSFIR